ncbi:MAG TPA: DUF1294 domain-containing protein [Erysipelotrichaceae bacterium]|nr:DUF1294 domain-containing protein [Erysipelotrichaceae bacterium]
MEKIVLPILIVLNLFGFVLMSLDKYFAIKQRSRISERSLLSMAFIGGSLGVYFGMVIFRHKTRKFSFNIGVPLMMALHFFLYWYLNT